MELQDKYKSQGLATIGVARDDEGWQKVIRSPPVMPPLWPGGSASSDCR